MPHHPAEVLAREDLRRLLAKAARAATASAQF